MKYKERKRKQKIQWKICCAQCGVVTGFSSHISVFPSQNDSFVYNRRLRNRSERQRLKVTQRRDNIFHTPFYSITHTNPVLPAL